MLTATERAVAALELLPEEMREAAVAYLIEQVEKFRSIQEEVGKGIEDARTGKVKEWDFAAFLSKSGVAGWD